MYNSIEFWRTVTIISAAIGQTCFTVLYVLFPWWKSFLGRALFFKASSFMILLDVAVLGRALDWSAEDLTFVGLYALVAAGVWAQFFAFLRIRLRGRNQQVKHDRRTHRETA